MAVKWDATMDQPLLLLIISMIALNWTQVASRWAEVYGLSEKKDTVVDISTDLSCRSGRRATADEESHHRTHRQASQDRRWLSRSLVENFRWYWFDLRTIGLPDLLQASFESGRQQEAFFCFNIERQRQTEGH